MKVREALNIAIREAVKDGRINRKKQGAVIEAARKVASVMDAPEWPIVRGKIDNVSPGVFLKYCEKLGLTVEATKGQQDQKDLKSDKVVEIIGNSKWKKHAHG